MIRRTWTARTLGAAMLAAGLSAGCGGDDGGGAKTNPPKVTSPCDLPDGGSLACGSTGRCVLDHGEPVCMCDDGYEGEACDQCEPGYQQDPLSAKCRPIPIDCAQTPNICGAHGLCRIDRCACDEGYRGHLCNECQIGLQDNDGDGACLPDCTKAELRCVGLRVCSDESGEAVCQCADGYDGDSCRECAQGYVDVAGDGVCIPTCAVANLDCSGNGQCVDASGYPRCLCDIGYRGADCSECAATHDSDGTGACRANPDWSRYLVATALDAEERPVLGAIDFAATWQFHPLVSLDRAIGGLTVDPSTNTLWSVTREHPEALVVVDPVTGELDVRLDLSSYHSVGNPVFDPLAGVIHLSTMRGASGSNIEYDPVTDKASSGAHALGGAAASTATTYDASLNRFLRVTGGANGNRTSEFNPLAETWEDGPNLSVERAFSYPGLAVVPAGADTYLAARKLPNEDEAVIGECRLLAESLGFDASDHVAFGGYQAAPDGTEIVLQASGIEPPVVGYGSYGDRSDPYTPMLIDVHHPHAVVCVIVYEAKLRIVVPKTARFGLLLLKSYEPTLALEVEDGFEASIPNLAPIHAWMSGEPDPSIAQSPWVVSEGYAPAYSAEEDAESAFCAVQWSSGATVCVELEDVKLQGGLAWLGGGL